MNIKNNIIFESPDRGKTVYLRYFGSTEKILYKENLPQIKEQMRLEDYAKRYSKEIINIQIT